MAADGRTAGRWPSRAQRIRLDSIFHTAISYTIFLRRSVVDRVGGFDEQLGLGSGTAWSSGEEIDYLVRALRAGARVEYDPSLVVTHPVKPPSPDGLVALGRRDGGSLGYVLAANRLSPGDDRCGCCCGRSSRPPPSRSSSTARARGSSSRPSAAASEGWSPDRTRR